MTKITKLIVYLKSNYKMTCFSLIMIYINMFVTILIFGNYMLSVFNSYFAFSIMAFGYESFMIHKKRKEGKHDEVKKNKKHKKAT